MAEAAQGPAVNPIAGRFLALSPLIRAVGFAGDARQLLLATTGLLLLWAGWSGLDSALGGPSGPEATPFRPGLAVSGLDVPTSDLPRALLVRVAEPPRVIVSAFAGLFTPGVGPREWLGFALKAAWAALVWGVLGGAIARVAAVRFATGRRVGVGTALRFASRRSVSLVGAPLTALLATSVFAGCAAAFGLLYRIPGGVGSTVAGLLGFVPLMLGLVMALILLGLALGWPLMHATVAVEGEDAADALSRSYAYVNQRLARYAAHVVAAWGLGAVGLGLVIAFARVVLELADWGVGLGAPEVPELSPTSEALRDGWIGFVGLLVHAWAYSYFWTAATSIYLILRRDVNGADWHDVYLPEHDADTFTGPAEKADAADAPAA